MHRVYTISRAEFTTAGAAPSEKISQPKPPVLDGVDETIVADLVRQLAEIDFEGMDAEIVDDGGEPIAEDADYAIGMLAARSAAYDAVIEAAEAVASPEKTPEPAPARPLPARKRALIDLVPAQHSAKRRAREAALIEHKIAYTPDAIERERRIIKQRDYRERTKKALAGKTIRIVRLTRDEVRNRQRTLEAWSQTQPPKSSWWDPKRVREAVKDWITFQRLAEKLERAPMGAEFAKALEVNRFKGRDRLQRLVKLEHTGGAWAI